jgi:hypothetical protein
LGLEHPRHPLLLLLLLLRLRLVPMRADVVLLLLLLLVVAVQLLATCCKECVPPLLLGPHPEPPHSPCHIGQLLGLQLGHPTAAAAAEALQQQLQ